MQAIKDDEKTYFNFMMRKPYSGGREIKKNQKELTFGESLSDNLLGDLLPRDFRLPSS